MLVYQRVNPFGAIPIHTHPFQTPAPNSKPCLQAQSLYHLEFHGVQHLKTARNNGAIHHSKWL